MIVGAAQIQLFGTKLSLPAYISSKMIALL